MDRALLWLHSTYNLVSYRLPIKWNTRMSKILYHWFLSSDSFPFCETNFTLHQAVRGQPECDFSILGRWIMLNKSKACTACSVEDETRNARRNTKRTPEWSSQVSFQTAHLKKDENFDHRGLCWAFRPAFRVSSSTERAALCTPYPEILDGLSSCLFSNEPFEKRPVMTIHNFVEHSDEHFESHLDHVHPIPPAVTFL